MYQNPIYKLPPALLKVLIGKINLKIEDEVKKL
jgi:hypothetical protein